MPDLIRQWVERFGAVRSALIVAVGLVTMLLIWGASRWATAPQWVPVFAGMTLQTAGQVTTQLDQAKVPYRLEAGGADVEVKSSDLARARVLLAQQGLPSSNSPGFELFDRPSWGMTDFTQRVNYRRALEGELERTIAEMRGVESAQVQLAIHESSPFRQSNQPEQASVFLRLRGGETLSAEQVDGIKALVASSADGLTRDHVTVLDDSGRLLAASVEPGDEADGMTKRQLALQQQVESSLEARAEDLVSQVVGRGNARVQVSATLNFDRVDSTTRRVNPDQQVATKEQRSQVTPGTPSQGASSTVENTTYDVTQTTEQFRRATGDIRRLSVAVLVNAAPAGRGARTAADSAGAAGGPARVTPAELSRIQALVTTAVGLDPTRGDKITVVAIPFGAPDVTPPPVGAAPGGPGWLGILAALERPALGVLALLLAFFVGLRTVAALRATREGQRPVPKQALPAGDGGVPPHLRLVEADDGAAPAGIEGREQAGAVVASRPDNARRVIRAWMKEA